MYRAILTSAVVCMCMTMPRVLHASPILEPGDSVAQGYAIEVGAVGYGGMSEFASTVEGISPNAYGLVLRDRNGATARAAMGILIIFAGAAAASSPKSVNTKTYRSGDYQVTETTTTYRSQAEQQAIMASSAGAASGLFILPLAEFELEVFGRDRLGYGDSSGHKLNMLFGSGEPSWYFELGMGWGNVNSRVESNGVINHLDHKYFGMPFRMGGAISVVSWTATWEWNWLAHGVDYDEKVAQMLPNGDQAMQVAHHPLRLELESVLFGRVYAQGGVVFPSVKKFETGYRASLGFRF